jgi:hypothetical protein
MLDRPVVELDFAIAETGGDRGSEADGEVGGCRTQHFVQTALTDCRAAGVLAPDARHRKIDQGPSASSGDPLAANRVSNRGDRLSETKLI